MQTTISTAVLTACALTAPALAGSATFTLLTTEDAADVTIDEFGRTLVLTPSAGSVFVYEDGAYAFVGAGDAKSISADGNWIGGSTLAMDGEQEAARGAATGGWLTLGGIGECGYRGSGYGVSGDGAKVVGLGWDGCNALGFLWTQATGMTALAEQGNGNNRASVISTNGEVIGGFAQANSRTPAAWLASTGAPHPTFPFNFDAAGEIGAVSSDGSILAGEYYDENVPGFYNLPFFWTEQDGIVLLPPVPGFDGGDVLGVSDDKRTFVGVSGTILTGRTAAVWRPEWGAVRLEDKLAELGAPVPDGFSPQVARGVTDDGETVVGWGLLAPDQPGELSTFRGFVATLPPAETLPCPADLNADGTVGFADLTQLLNTWGPCPNCDEDIDDSGQVGFSDLTILLNAWGPCP